MQLDQPAEVVRELLPVAAALVPLWAAAALWLTRLPERDERGALALALLWNAVSLPAMHTFAVAAGWWHIDLAGPALAGLPLPLWIGWSVLWGVVAPLLRLHPATAVAALLGADLVLMPLLEPVVVLGGSWLLGEVVALATVALPGLLLARWSTTRTCLRGRALLQVALFTTLLLWFLPLVAVTVAGRSLTPHLGAQWWGVALGLLGLASLPGVVGVVDFESNGGTPWPWDSTKRPVLSGAYRYVRSPMQTSAVVVLCLSSVAYRDYAIAVGAIVTLGYSQIFCRFESRTVTERFGATWLSVAGDQRRWWPSWRPHRLATHGVLWVDFDCGACSRLGTLLQRRDPVGLSIQPASAHQHQLNRVRYERGDGVTFDGVAAVGAALEHCNLALALAGWVLRLPLLSRLWQLVADGVGFGPRPAGRAAIVAPAASLPPLSVSCGAAQNTLARSEDGHRSSVSNDAARGL